MDPEQRQRIIGYFLEESQEYLELLEPGVQDLASALADPERINELYRAAHSIKGGAAMLELHGIQKVAYRLESSLKFIKNNPLQPNQTVEATLLQGVEGLKRLTAEVQATSDLSEASSTEVWGTIEPVFDSLDGTLEQLAATHTTGQDLEVANDHAIAHDIDLPPVAETIDTSDDLDELSWDELEGLSDLNTQKTESASTQRVDAPESEIDGLDELANLFDENVGGEDWDLEANSSSDAVSETAPTSDAAQALEALFDDDLLSTPAESDLELENLLDLGDESAPDSSETTSASLVESPATAEAPDSLDSLDSLFADEPGEESLGEELLGEESLVLETDDEFSLSPVESLESLGAEPTELPSLPSEQDDSDLEQLLEDTPEAESLDPEGILDLFSDDENSNIAVESDGAELTSETDSLLSLESQEVTETATSLLGEATAIAEENTDPATSANSIAPESELFSEDTLAALGEAPALENPDLTDELGLGLGELDSLEGGLDDSDGLHGLDAMLEEASGNASTSSIASDETQAKNDAAETSEESLAFDDLDSFLNDIADEPGEASLEDDFDDLDSLLGDSPSDAAPAPTSQQTQEADADFADMDQLLQEAQSLGGGAKAAAPTAAAPPTKGRKRSQRLIEQTMRVPVKTLDNLSNLVGEMVVTRNSLEGDQERLRQALDKLSGHTQQLSDVGQQLQDLYERSLLENALLNSRRKVMGTEPGNGLLALGGSSVLGGSSILGNNSESESDSESAQDLDDLELDRFSTFHTLSQDIIEMIVRIKESTDDIDFLVNESLDQVARNFRQTTGQLQEDVNRSRMVPFSQTADRLPRAVRDISRKCGKDATLTVDGRETLVDKMLVEQLHDPLTHLINNAVTHGIETQDERILAGKPPAGNIRLQAFYQGNQTVISIADDGAGIDPDVIKRKAIQKGLLRKDEADSLNQAQIYDFLFHAGFSTRDKADAFAGRGVGMDVVRTRLQELRGTIVTDSEVGKGTTFTIRLPLTLSITKALHCISNRARIAFPFDGVEDMFDIPRDQLINNEEEQPCIQWRDMLLPVRSLSDLLKYNRTIGRSSVYAGTSDDDMLALVILRGAGEYLAVSVDRVEGEMDIVIKQLEGPVPKPAGIAGATVLADGQVMPIADVLELLDISKGRARQGMASMWEEESAGLDEPTETPVSDPLVLIVDDSITVRELLSMSFAKAGYRVEQARDGQEAWEKLRSGLPCDLVFCDIEMPRMTGLELLERLQKDEVLNQLPIAMLTSRGADRHRNLAAKFGARGYFTKPYLEESLLEAAGRLLKGEVLMNQPAEAGDS